MMPFPRNLVLVVLLLLTLSIHAQRDRVDSGYIIYTLGMDTSMAGRYQLRYDLFEITLVSRPPVTVTKVRGRLFANGELQSADGFAFKPGPQGDTVLVSYRLYVRNDSTYIDQKRDTVTTTQRFAGRGMINNSMGPFFRFLIPFWTHYGPQKVGDSVIRRHHTLGTSKDFVIKRVERDLLQAGSTVTGKINIHLNHLGRVRLIDGMGSSSNSIGHLLPQFDLDGLVNRFLQQEQRGIGTAPVNKPDSVIAKVGNANIKIYYSRPLARGRTIFGSVVPYERFWRTGANASTRFVTDQPLTFPHNKVLPAGSYSLWTFPSKNGWTLMFNSQANVWGTEYNPAFDVLKVPMQVTPMTEHVEMMTIAVEPEGRLHVMWEKTRASVNFK